MHDLVRATAFQFWQFNVGNLGNVGNEQNSLHPERDRWIDLRRAMSRRKDR